MSLSFILKLRNLNQIIFFKVPQVQYEFKIACMNNSMPRGICLFWLIKTSKNEIDMSILLKSNLFNSFIEIKYWLFEINDSEEKVSTPLR